MDQSFDNIEKKIRIKRVWQAPEFKTLSVKETGTGSYWTREREDGTYTIPTGNS